MLSLSGNGSAHLSEGGLDGERIDDQDVNAIEWDVTELCDLVAQILDVCLLQSEVTVVELLGETWLSHGALEVGVKHAHVEVEEVRCVIWGQNGLDEASENSSNIWDVC